MRGARRMHMVRLTPGPGLNAQEIRMASSAGGVYPPSIGSRTGALNRSRASSFAKASVDGSGMLFSCNFASSAASGESDDVLHLGIAVRRATSIARPSLEHSGRLSRQARVVLFGYGDGRAARDSSRSVLIRLRRMSRPPPAPYLKAAVPSRASGKGARAYAPTNVVDVVHDRLAWPGHVRTTASAGQAQKRQLGPARG
jgi:hypothetical protein